MTRPNIYSRITNLKSQLLAYKTRQKSSSGSIKVFTVQTQDEWDIVWSKPDLSTGNKVWHIKFTPDNQVAPFANVRTIVNFKGAPYNPATDKLPVYVDSASGASVISRSTQPLYWGVFVGDWAGVGESIQVKVLLDATDTGVLTVTEAVY